MNRLKYSPIDRNTVRLIIIIFQMEAVALIANANSSIRWQIADRIACGYAMPMAVPIVMMNNA